MTGSRHREHGPPEGLPFAHDPKAVAVHRLSAGVRQRTGIKVQAQTEAKLMRIFGTMSPDMLLAWVHQLEQLPQDHPEWLAVIENLTVHETYFFRDPQQLGMLRRSVLPDLVKEAIGNGRRLRLWSAGCASGEEAYTLAILLLETLLEMSEARGSPQEGVRPYPNWRIEIIGTDISRHMVELARQGVYHTGELSPFRSMPQTYAAWFEDFADDERPGQYLRRVRRWLLPFVEFRQANLLSTAAGEARFQLISCRNVFIYLTADARAQVQATFARSQDPGACLILGTTDHLAAKGDYAAEWLDGGVVYRRL